MQLLQAHCRSWIETTYDDLVSVCVGCDVAGEPAVVEGIYTEVGADERLRGVLQTRTTLAQRVVNSSTEGLNSYMSKR